MSTRIEERPHEDHCLRFPIVVTLAVALAVPSLALASGGLRNTVERAQGHAAIRDDRWETRDDLHDLARLDAAVDDWNDARRTKNRRAEEAADVRPTGDPVSSG
jgi:hypothetical protein